MQQAEETEAEIDRTRGQYEPVAFRAATLYFCITDLGHVDPMYQYSLPWFTDLFVASIKNSAPAGSDIAKRIGNINAHFTYSIYKNVCRSLFERHKLLFSFLMTIKVLQGDGAVDPEEWRFLISGQGPTNPPEATKPLVRAPCWCQPLHSTHTTPPPSPPPTGRRVAQ